jgi:pimeloyl-ACP methyl ester carboxylesterase
MKLEPHGVGRERPAQQPYHDRALAFVDPLFARPALIIEGDDPVGRARQVGDDEADARIKFAGMPLDLGDNPSAAWSAFFRLNEDLLPMVRSRTQMIPKLKEFRRPVRIIFGDADPSLNSGVARTFHEFLPGSELFLIPGARHFVQLDEPEQVARLILAMPGPESAPV